MLENTLNYGVKETDAVRDTEVMEMNDIRKK